VKWTSLPVLVRAIATALLVSSPALFLNALLPLNTLLFPRVPWAPLVVGSCLWCLWSYLRGGGWPRSSSAARKQYLRGKIPAAPVWRWSLIAGLLATTSLRALFDIARRFSYHPEQDLTSADVLNKFPFFTVLLLLLSAAVIAGVIEEAAFRGYLQVPLENRYGPKTAILIVGLLFVVAHYRPGAPDLQPWLIFSPAYMAAAVAFGALAYLSGSIVPGIICHALFDAVALLQYWWFGIPKNIWQARWDSALAVRCVVAPVFASAAYLAYRKLARVRVQPRTVFVPAPRTSARL
jgi:membrane protease YdiL (CAAX protease family)